MRNSSIRFLSIFVSVILLTAFACNPSMLMAACTNVTVGTGSSTGYYTPLNNFYNYSLTEMIFLSSEIGRTDGGTIEKIGFQYGYTTGMSSKTNVKIYMANTTRSSFASGAVSECVTTGLTLVYSGALNCSGSGTWNDFTLSTPFNYSGGNLLVVVDDNSGAYDGTSYVFRYTTTTGNTVWRYQSDSDYRSISTIGSYTSACSYGTYRVNTRFCISAPCTHRSGASSFAFSGSGSYNYTLGSGDFVEPTLQSTGMTPSGGTVSYISSNTSVATVASNGNVVFMGGTGTVTITAISSLDGYCDEVASYTITVSDGCAQIGDGANVSSSGIYGGIYTYLNYYAYTQQVYTASEILAAGGCSGIVTSIALHYSGTTSTALSFEVYLGMTNQSTISTSWITNANLQQVYSGTRTFTSANDGWNSIDISSANWEWDGTSNILVAIRRTSSTTGSVSYPNFYHTNSTSMCVYLTNSSSEISLNANNVASDAGSTTVQRPEMKFCIQCCTMPNLAFAQDVVYCVNGGSCAGQTVSVNQSGGAVTYQSSNTSVATVNATTGAISLVGTGTTTITASVEETGNYCHKTASYTLIVQCGTTPHTLTYNTQANCTGGTATTVASYTGTATTVTTTTPDCSSATRFVGWCANASGTGYRYTPGEIVDLTCGDVTLYALYSFEPDTIQGATTCEEAQAFCASNDEDNGVILMAATDVDAPDGMCTFFQNASWWYLQVSQAGRLEMTISSTAGDVDFGCWGPFDNFTCAAADLSDNAATETYYTSSTTTDWGYQVGTSHSASSSNSPICDVAALTYPCGNLVDFGGSTSAVEYLQIDNAQVGQIYVVLVANYSGSEGTITFTQTNFSASNHGLVDCDIVSNCEINVITTNTTACNQANNTYTVSGDIYFTEAPSTGTLTITDNTANPPVSQVFNAPFASSPIAYSLQVPADGASHQLEAAFSSSDCSKLAVYTAPDPCNDCSSSVSHTDVTCNGASDGTITLTATAGYGQRSYYLGRNGSTPTLSQTTTATTYTWSNLQGGTYVVYVKDANDCISEQTVVITEQPAVTLSLTTPTTDNCPIAAGQNYTVTATPGGGTGIYQNYQWSVTVDGAVGTINGSGNSASIAGDGTCHEYEVTLALTDGDGCPATATESFASVDNDAPTFGNTALVANPTVEATRAGNCTYQVPDLVALLSPQDNCTIESATQAPLAAGAAITATTTVTVTVTDKCGKTTQQAISVTVPDPLTADIDKTDVACNGGNNGTVTLSNVAGGTPTYSYAWTSTGTGATNVSSQTGTNLTALTAGTYTVTISDQNGCTLQKTATVSQAGSLVADISATPTNCYNGTEGGSVTLSGISGGTGTLHYSWTQTIDGNSTTLTAENDNTSISNYPAGTYTVVISDEEGCELTKIAEIGQPDEMRVDIDNTTNVNCYGNATGAITITAYGGDGNYNYSWTGPNGYTSTTEDPTGLRAGTYNIEVMDGNNCPATNSATLTQSDTLVASAGTSANQICNGESATISVTAEGGNDTRYTYAWDNGSIAASQQVTPAATTTYHVTVTDANGCTDVAEVTVNVNQPTTGVDPQTACDEFTWHGTTYTSSNNTATFTSTGANGCDSVTTLNLTINNSNDAVFEVVACESYDWHGNTYTQSTTTPTFTSTNAAGCDSVTTLHLTVYHNDYQSHEATACDTYTWTIRGHSYTRTSSDVIVDTYTIGSCTGADTLHLTINPSTTGVDYEEACDEFTWSRNGWSYTSSISSSSANAPRVLMQGANYNGCDSTVILDLTIKNSTSGIFTHTACDYYLWPMNSQEYYATPAVAPSVYAGQNAAGCDSTVALHLTINHSTTSNDVHTVCDSYTWPLNGQTYTSSTNEPQVVITNRAGCDSTITLRLTVNNTRYGSYIDTVCSGEQLTYRGNRYPAGQHSVTIPGTNGCDSIVALQVVARQPLSLSIEEFHSCELAHYQVTGTVNSSNANNVITVWTARPSDPDVETQRDNLEISVNPTQATEYTLTAGYGPSRLCSVSQSITLTPLNLPIADITFTPPFLTCDDLAWTATSASQNAESVTWYVNDIETSVEDVITGSAECDDDSVRISLVAVNGICNDVHDTVIYVRKSQIWFPNVFTPNLNINKTFNAFGHGIVEYELYVYTREGLLVFHSTSLEDSWKGDHNGTECPRAAYTYIARYRTEIEPEVWHKQIGTVILLR